MNALQGGLNVIFWFSIALDVDSHGAPIISGRIPIVLTRFIFQRAVLGRPASLALREPHCAYIQATMCLTAGGPDLECVGQTILAARAKGLASNSLPIVLPLVSTALSLLYACVLWCVRAPGTSGLNATHMITIGGWDAPHAITTNSPQAVYDSWKMWNEDVVAHTVPVTSLMIWLVTYNSV